MLTCLWEKNNSGPSCSALLASSPMRTDFYFRVREDFLRNQLGNETWWICREETDREGSREGRGEKAWEGLWRGENSGGGDLTEVQHSQGTGGRGGGRTTRQLPENGLQEIQMVQQQLAGKRKPRSTGSGILPKPEWPWEEGPKLQRHGSSVHHPTPTPCSTPLFHLAVSELHPLE